MIIFIKREKSIWQNSTTYHETTLNKLGVERDFINLIKGIYEICTGSIIFNYEKSKTFSISVGELCPTEPSQLPQMRINLPRHDLLGEERWPLSLRGRALSTSFPGFLFGLVCLEIQGVYKKLINHCQAVIIKE